MDGTLIKRDDNFYSLRVDGLVMATSNGMLVDHKLSIKNCEAIANGYDLDELAENTFSITPSNELHHQIRNQSFKLGFQKALELLGDKKFSEDALKLAYSSGWTQRHNAEGSYYGMQKEFIQSLQQTEWDVEICCYVDSSNGWLDADSFNSPLLTNTGEPKLDVDGCLILKRKV